MMTEIVSSDAYAEANAEMLNTWLSSSAPFRKSMETAVNQSLAALNLAARDDYTRLAERLTNIEMRLDDMDAKQDDINAKLDELVRRQPHNQG
jgi:peptidoglycan hydrolase CwlO-like protein